MKLGSTCGIGMLAFIFVILGQVHGANPEIVNRNDRKPHQIERAVSAIKIDGNLDDAAWGGALKLEIAYEVRPGENVKPPVKTFVYLAYDDEAVLVGFKCYDPDPAKIRARYTDRDNAWNDDWVGIVLDTFNDQRRAYEFLCNPLGVQTDAINDDLSGNYDTSWNAIWRSSGRITEDGFEVEMAIPFNQLRFQSSDGPQTWGIDAIRSYPRTHRHHIGLFPRSRGQNSYLSQTDKMVGLSGITPGKNIEIVPTLTGFRTDARDGLPSGGFRELASAEDLGVTARWGITPNLTLNGTLNPDFSQVEADAVQLDINETFALFFRETRPFFLEGADYFNTRINLVHTRSIANPSSALKVTGKQGRHTYGAFAAKDDVTNLILPGTEGSNAGSFQFETTNTVGRYRFDFGGNSSVGAMVTSREGDDYHNRILSLDSTYRLTDADTFSLNVAGSQTQYSQQIRDSFELENAEEISDRAISFQYRHSKRNWSARLNYDDFGEDFRADMGFQPQVNFRKLVSGGNYVWYGDEGKAYNRIELGGDFDQTETQEGELFEREWEGWFVYAGPKESFLWVNLGTRTRVFNQVAFDQFYQNLFFETRANANLYFSLDVGRGDWIDFQHNREAKRFIYEPQVQLNFGKHVFLRVRNAYSGLDVEGGRLFTANVPQLRFIYHYNSRVLFRAIMQYASITRDPQLYSQEVEPESEDLFTQLLFSYKLNPQTVAFLGYSDNYTGNQEFDLTQRDRTLFVKVGYAWLH